MQYQARGKTKDGREYLLRSARPEDARAILDCDRKIHGESEYLTRYGDEPARTLEKEAALLSRMEESPQMVYLCAILADEIVGLASIVGIGSARKLRHRCSFGISIEASCWKLGIGRAMTEACLELALEAGYEQVELEVTADNRRAIALYKAAGFVEYGRNPRGFKKIDGQWQELVLMRMEL